VVEHLGGLVDKSMVVVTDAAPVPRYALLETARAYALEKLAERGETDSSMLRHAQALKRLLRIYEQDDRRWRCSDADNRAAAEGPGSERVKGIFPNTHLFEVMMKAFRWKAGDK
jgi:predicted ATPase